MNDKKKYHPDLMSQKHKLHHNFLDRSSVPVPLLHTQLPEVEFQTEYLISLAVRSHAHQSCQEIDSWTRLSKHSPTATPTHTHTHAHTALRTIKVSL